MAFRVPNEYRVRHGRYASDDAIGNFGAFVFSIGMYRVRTIAAEGEGWCHVSVSIEDQAPAWDVMCAVKAIFWEPEDCVMQLHPPQSDYVNCHPYTLHLWQPIGVEIPRPPRWMV